MATNAQARDDGDDTLAGDDDLAPGDGDTANKTDKTTDAPQKGGKAGDESKDDDAGGEGDNAPAEVARLRKELRQAKAAVTTLTRQRDEATNKLAKVGEAADGADPETVVEELRQAREELASVRAANRKAQVTEAVREVLSQEKYAPYAGTVRYIVPTLELDDEADIGPDGRYDPEVLKEAALDAVKQYQQDNPRQPKRESAGGLGGDPARNGAAPGGKEQNELARLAGLGYGAARRLGGGR